MTKILEDVVLRGCTLQQLNEEGAGLYQEATEDTFRKCFLVGATTDFRELETDVRKSLIEKGYDGLVEAYNELCFSLCFKYQLVTGTPIVRIK